MFYISLPHLREAAAGMAGKKDPRANLKGVHVYRGDEGVITLTGTNGRVGIVTRFNEADALGAGELDTTEKQFILTAEGVKTLLQVGLKNDWVLLAPRSDLPVEADEWVARFHHDSYGKGYIVRVIQGSNHVNVDEVFRHTKSAIETPNTLFMTVSLSLPVLEVLVKLAREWGEFDKCRSEPSVRLCISADSGRLHAHNAIPILPTDPAHNAFALVMPVQMVGDGELQDTFPKACSRMGAVKFPEWY